MKLKFSEALPPLFRDATKDNMMFPRRLGQPDDITHCIKFIIENKFINAEVIRLDGGYRSGIH